MRISVLLRKSLAHFLKIRQPNAEPQVPRRLQHEASRRLAKGALSAHHAQASLARLGGVRGTPDRRLLVVGQAESLLDLCGVGRSAGRQLAAAGMEDACISRDVLQAYVDHQLSRIPGRR